MELYFVALSSRKYFQLDEHLQQQDLRKPLRAWSEALLSWWSSVPHQRNLSKPPSLLWTPPSHSEAFFAHFFAHFFSLSTSLSLVLDLSYAWNFSCSLLLLPLVFHRQCPALTPNLSRLLALLSSPQHLLQRTWTNTSGNPCCLRSNNIYTQRYIFRFTWERPFWCFLFFAEV